MTSADPMCVGDSLQGNSKSRGSCLPGEIEAQPRVMHLIPVMVSILSYKDVNPSRGHDVAQAAQTTLSKCLSGAFAVLDWE